MDQYTVFPDRAIETIGLVSKQFMDRDIHTFWEACRYVHQLPYGYNSDRDDLLILFKEQMGTCTTKHAVIATLAHELQLPVNKSIGIYAMTEELVTGTQNILDTFNLPYLPMVHCFLTDDRHRVDLTEGNNNGKNRSIERFLYVRTVASNISAKDEYLLYRRELKVLMDQRPEFQGVDIKQVLHAREEGLVLLKSEVR